MREMMEWGLEGEEARIGATRFTRVRSCILSPPLLTHSPSSPHANARLVLKIMHATSLKALGTKRTEIGEILARKQFLDPKNTQYSQNYAILRNAILRNIKDYITFAPKQ